jgi:hypothetical protein
MRERFGGQSAGQFTPFVREKLARACRLTERRSDLGLGSDDVKER